MTITFRRQFGFEFICKCEPEGYNVTIRKNNVLIKEDIKLSTMEEFKEYVRQYMRDHKEALSNCLMNVY